MGLFDFFFGIPNNVLITKNGRVYYSVSEEEIPQWVWKKFGKMEKHGAETGSFKGKKFRYIIQYKGAGFYECWKRKREKA